MVDGIGDHLEESVADGVCDDRFASLVTQGSSSGVVTLAVMLFVLFGMSVKDGGKWNASGRK